MQRFSKISRPALLQMKGTTGVLELLRTGFSAACSIDKVD